MCTSHSVMEGQRHNSCSMWKMWVYMQKYLCLLLCEIACNVERFNIFLQAGRAILQKILWLFWCRSSLQLRRSLGFCTCCYGSRMCCELMLFWTQFKLCLLLSKWSWVLSASLSFQGTIMSLSLPYRVFQITHICRHQLQNCVIQYSIMHIFIGICQFVIYIVLHVHVYYNIYLLKNSCVVFLHFRSWLTNDGLIVRSDIAQTSWRGLSSIGSRHLPGDCCFFRIIYSDSLMSACLVLRMQCSFVIVC